MAMVVKNNMSAVNTLNVLNANSAALAKDLQHVATGMKVNSAADDNSGYAISERMQARIRALNQADQNTQNGANMLKVAEGAVSSTVDILKTMKEKAINAANDSNTDQDRAAIQKELNQSIDQIDDNALITYNGKTLVDGSKMAQGVATKTALTNQSLSEDTKGDTKLVDLANRNGEGLNIQTTDTLTISYVIQGRNYSVDMKVTDSMTLDSALQEATLPYTQDSPLLGSAWSAYYSSSSYAWSVYNSSYSDAQNTYNATYSTANSTYNSSLINAQTTYTQDVIDAQTGTTTYNTQNYTLVDAITQASSDIQNARVNYNTWSNILGSIPPGGSITLEIPGYGSVIYTYATASNNVNNYSTAITEATTAYGTLSTALSTSVSTAASTRDSTIGSASTSFHNADVAAQGVRNAAVSQASSVLSTAISTALSTLGEDIGDVVPYKLGVDASNVVGKAASGDTVYTANRENAITITAGSAGTKYQIAGLTFSVSDSKGLVKKSVNAVLDNFTESVRAVNKSNDNAITLQVDAKANQAIRISLTDMRSEALGLKSSDGTTISVATQKHANAAVNVLDNAIQKALDQQTDIGAVANRMEQTSNNLHIARDNVQASESTIRDADMAKAMTSYTKNNILLQAAQSMLAQANQSGSNVLSLLQ